MTHTAFVAIGIVLIAFVVYLAIEQRGQDIVWYDAMSNALGEADAYELDSANALLTVAGVHASDPARPGEEKVTYTLNAVDQSPNYELGGTGDIQSTSGHDFNFVEGMCIDQALAGTGASLQLTTSFDSTASGCMFAAAAHGSHDTTYYTGNTLVGTATGVDIASADTSLLTVAGAEVADTARSGERRVNYTLTAVDQSPRYRLNGGSTTQATHGHALDFVDGTCMTNALAGDGAGGVRLTSNMTCTFAPVVHTHTHGHGTDIDPWTLNCSGLQSGTPVQRCFFDFDGSAVTPTNSMNATRNTYRDFSDDLAFAVTGNYVLTLELELHFDLPEIGAYLAGSGECPRGKTLVAMSSAVAVSPSPLGSETPIYASQFTEATRGNAMPAGNPYCEDDAGTPDTIPNRATDTRLMNWDLVEGNYIFDFYDLDGPDYLLTNETFTHRNINVAAGAQGRHYPNQHYVSVTLITDVTGVGDVLQFGLDELGGDAMLNRTLTKLHVTVLRVSALP